MIFDVDVVIVWPPCSSRMNTLTITVTLIPCNALRLLSRTLLIHRLVASKNWAMSSPQSSNTATVRYRRQAAWKQGTIGDAFTTCVMARDLSAARLRAAPMPPAEGSAHK